ncbi:MAG TPA: hypothetical protein PLM29_13850 [Deltaproteobacteria bacterium]|nr:hypothetical protein [Deltaproteobacteria bacterium]
MDLITTPTLFSGGSGALPANPEKAHYALINGVLSLLITAGIGVFFLVSDRLLLNQFPGVEADAQAGRRLLPI